MVLLVVIVAVSFYKYGQSIERSKEDIAELSYLDIPEDRFFKFLLLLGGIIKLELRM